MPRLSRNTKSEFGHETNSGTKKSDPLEQVRKDMHACIQCGTCTASCPNAFAMDLTPRCMWRLLVMGETKAVFASQTFVLCSSCYYCTLRCPRGLPLTSSMAALKRAAALEEPGKSKSGARFYKSFMESVRQYGRVREMEFMTKYFMSMKNPVLPLRFTPLGLRLLARRKISFKMPFKGGESLDAVFRKAAELEELP